MTSVSADDRIINIFPNSVHVFTQSTSLGWGCSREPKGWIHSNTFFFFKFATLIFTANTEGNPKVMTGMSCWTGAGTEVASGAHQEAESCRTLPSSSKVGARGDSFSFLLRGSPECCRHAVTSSASLLTACLQRLPRASHCFCSSRAPTCVPYYLC